MIGTVPSVVFPPTSSRDVALGRIPAVSRSERLSGSARAKAWRERMQRAIARPTKPIAPESDDWLGDWSLLGLAGVGLLGGIALAALSHPEPSAAQPARRENPLFGVTLADYAAMVAIGAGIALTAAGVVTGATSALVGFPLAVGGLAYYGVQVQS